ncbi:GH1 family beta-glucosidase [Luteipulveratus halotolerans]|uniref:Beta-glucosidase n=1 Tax=Luteipulveratus halotolerans TaxID=1631356 RepID=A0A0L6CF69_9MICO|nr:GH1 family beta-glucosidase [Luteipulveratus halotolerans]KNX36235.1 beta-glucosidase [Luteipulveratus halotolerans]
MSDFPALPTGFTIGTATASYQVEGAVDEDGRGRSVWDTFCAEPGRIKNGETGETACDHYHRYAGDIALMKDAGFDAYRFSIAWPRVLPTGSGEVNAAGLDFYDRLVDELVAAGIAPAATLFHWDLPQALQDAGGWQSRETALRLADYAAIVGERLGDRVQMWMPLNEPMVVTMLGYATGLHAPGLQLGFEALPVAHHLLLGHGLAVQALRSAGCDSVGIASNHAPTWPASSSDADREAADLYDGLVNRLFADPVLTGAYPEGFAEAMPGPVDDDLRIISTPLDWYGINCYAPSLVGAPGGSPDGPAAVGGAPVPAGLPFEPRQIADHPTTDFGWPIVPSAMTEILVTFHERYGDALPPVYITESGCSFHDVVAADGGVHDERRVAYHREHLAAVATAIDTGVDVRGYFVWSLLDNFEWAEGYTERFGLVHVDFDSQVRTPKDSYRWFQQLIKARHP